MIQVSNGFILRIQRLDELSTNPSISFDIVYTLSIISYKKFIKLFFSFEEIILGILLSSVTDK